MKAIGDPAAVSNMQNKDDKARNAVDTAKRLAPVIVDTVKKSSKDIGDTLYVNK